MNATGKRYNCTGNNIYEESTDGACIGAEWADVNGNTYRMLWVDCFSFSPRAKYAEMLYQLFIKPVGLSDWCYLKDVIDSIGSDKYFQGDIMNPLFGKRDDSPLDESGQLKEGLKTQVQFFTDNFIVNEHGIAVSFKQFIYPFIESTQNVTIVIPEDEI